MVDANVGETLVGAFPPPPDMFNEHLVSYLPLILLWAAVFTSLLFLSGPLSSLVCSCFLQYLSIHSYGFFFFQHTFLFIKKKYRLLFMRLLMDLMCTRIAAGP